MRRLLEQYCWMWRSIERWYPGNVPFRSVVFLWFFVRDVGVAGSQRVVTTCAIVLAAFVLATATAVEQGAHSDARGEPWTLSGAVASVSVPLETPAAEMGRLAADLMTLGVRQVEFTLDVGARRVP